MPTIRSLFFILVGCALSFTHGSVARSLEIDAIDTPQVCFLEGNYVLLYKIINWWNDSSVDEESLLCGDTLHCRSKGIASVIYDQKQKMMVITYRAEYLELLSIVDQCSFCSEQVLLRAHWLNKKVFGDILQTATLTVDSGVCRIFIKDISSRSAELISSMTTNLQISLRGTIKGLLLADGRIALHSKGVFLKDCSEIKNDSEGLSPVVVSIVNIFTEEILASFELETQGK